MYLNYEVILCSYNGSFYIIEQLESIIQQSIQPSKIILSDDGSSDNTILLVKEFLSNYDDIELVIIEGPRKGPSLNFLSTLKYSTEEYVFFADQDDVWLKDKIERYLDYITIFSKDVPQLFFSDALLVDENRNFEGFTHLQHLKIRPEELDSNSLIFLNYIQGATICLNSNLVNLINRQVKETGLNDIIIHDWWCALVANYFGEIVFIDEALIEYRQHDNNVIGSNRKFNIRTKTCLAFLMAKQYLKLYDLLQEDKKSKKKIKLFTLFTSKRLMQSVGLLKFSFVLFPFLLFSCLNCVTNNISKYKLDKSK
ncbi:glycosyltransferase family 2 protein [Photobacterium indicum]|uniref:glycosyltransferase family 2 protein n=1 Tax=Photobacterium indicum TaxID=81447 RepID=UPI003D09EB25